MKAETGFRLAETVGAGPLEAVALDGRQISADQIVIATGFRPDLAMLREVRVSLDPALECPTALVPLIDPNLHSCGTLRPHGAAELAHPEPGFFIADMKSYGRLPNLVIGQLACALVIAPTVASATASSCALRACCARETVKLGCRRVGFSQALKIQPLQGIVSVTKTAFGEAQS